MTNGGCNAGWKTSCRLNVLYLLGDPASSDVKPTLRRADIVLHQKLSDFQLVFQKPRCRDLHFPCTHFPSTCIVNFCFSWQFPVFLRMAFNSLQQKASPRCKHVGGGSDSSSSAASLRNTERDRERTMPWSCTTLAQNGESPRKACLFYSQGWHQNLILTLCVFLIA